MKILRPLFLAGGFALAALIGGQQVFNASVTPRVNSWLIEQQRVVDAEGAKAPFEARAAVAFSRFPQAALNVFAPPANAQTVPQQDCTNCVFRNHTSVAQGSRPSAAGATLTSGSTDFRGQVTAPTLSSVVVTFGTAYLSAPICTVTKSDAISTAGGWTVSTTALTLTSTTTGAGAIYNWICFGVMQ